VRGEYAFVASGEGGLEVFDVANVDNKDFSERIVSAPVSPLGQRTFVKTSFAAAVALPSTMPMDPTRKTQFIPENEEQPIHPLYRYAYIADRDEGLVIVDVTTLTDGNPGNNFLSRALTFNPDNILDGANTIAVAGRWLFIGADEGLVIIDIDTPLAPHILTTLDGFEKQTAIAVQFRYAFVTDARDCTRSTSPTPRSRVTPRPSRSPTRATSTSPAPTHTSPAARKASSSSTSRSPRSPSSIRCSMTTCTT
jgi:hypothetical protein